MRMRFLTHRGRSRHAFTLIELIVVIAVLLALVAISLPSLVGTRDAARSTNAQSMLTNAYRHAKVIWAGADGYPQMAVLLERLNLSEPGVVFTDDDAEQIDTDTVWVQRDDQMQITMCTRSELGAHLCMRADELGALQVSWLSPEPLAHQAMENSAVLARSWGTTHATAVCHLPSRTSGIGIDCPEGERGGTGWRVTVSRG